MLKKDEAVKRELRLQVLKLQVKLSPPGPAAIPGARGGLWLPGMLTKDNRVRHSSKEGVHMETGQRMEQETTLFSWACWCLSFSANRD